MGVSDWRKQINELDRKILALLNERGRYVLRLAPLKRQKKMPIREPQREQQVLSNLRRHNEGPLSNEAACRIFEAIMEEMRAMQRAQGQTEGLSSGLSEQARASSDLRSERR